MKINNKIILNILKLVILIIFLSPIIVLIYNSFLGFSKDWYFLLWYGLKNTIEVVSGSVIVSLIIGLPSAIFLSYYNIKFKNFFVWSIVLSLIIPGYTLALLYSDIFNFIYSKLGLILILGISASPYIFLSSYISLNNTSKKYIISAKSLGLSNSQIIRKILLPLIKPAILFGIIIVVAESSADFGASFFLGVRTLMVNIYNLFFSIYDKVTGSQFSIILLSIIFLVSFVIKPFKNNFNRFINVKNGDILLSNSKEDLPNSKIIKLFIYLYLFIVSFITILLPLGILFYWLYLSRYTILEDTSYLSPLFNTLLLIFVGIILINITSYILIKLFRKNSLIMNGLILSYGIPGLLIGLGLIQLTPLVHNYFTGFLVLILGLVIKITPLAIQNIYTQYIKISPKLRKIWYSLGRNRIDYIKKIELPLLKPGFIAAIATIFIEIIRELPITLILSPFNFNTLATKIFFYQSSEQVEKSAIIIFFMIILSIIPIIYLYKKKIKL